MRALTLAVLTVGILGDSCQPELSVTPMTGELWLQQADLLGRDVELVRYWRSFEAGRPGMFGLGFTTPWEVRVERRTRRDGTTSVRVRDPMSEGRFGLSPVPIPEPSAAALAASVRQVARTLEVAGEEGLAAQVRPYADRLAAEEAAALEDYWRQAKAWREEAVAASRSPRGIEPPNLIWRVLTLPGLTLRYDPVYRVQVFDAQGRLERLLDREGRSLRIERDPKGRIRCVARGDDSRLAFDLDGAGRVVRARNGTGAEVTYRYDARGRLVHVRDRRGESRYTWGGRDGLLLLRAQIPEGWARISWEPGAGGARVARASGDLGSSSFSYGALIGGTVHSTNVVEERRVHLFESVKKVQGVDLFTYVEKVQADGRRSLRSVAHLAADRTGKQDPSVDQVLLDDLFQIPVAWDMGGKARVGVNARGRYWMVELEKKGRVQVDYGEDGQVSLVERYQSYPGNGVPEARIWIARSKTGAIEAIRFLDGFEVKPPANVDKSPEEFRFRESEGSRERVAVFVDPSEPGLPMTCALDGGVPVPMPSAEPAGRPEEAPPADATTSRTCQSVRERVDLAFELLETAQVLAGWGAFPEDIDPWSHSNHRWSPDASILFR